MTNWLYWSSERHWQDSVPRKKCFKRLPIVSNSLLHLRPCGDNDNNKNNNTSSTTTDNHNSIFHGAVATTRIQATLILPIRTPEGNLAGGE
mmetsp:Transcript_2366/g.5493  ORF Transcript_2366/g.5493 Transcript_2366/m.5493 type:complete len:91 (+) Transcript_2366:443-715(+)